MSPPPINKAMFLEAWMNTWHRYLLKILFLGSVIKEMQESGDGEFFLLLFCFIWRGIFPRGTAGKVYHQWYHELWFLTLDLTRQPLFFLFSKPGSSKCLGFQKFHEPPKIFSKHLLPACTLHRYIFSYLQIRSQM